MTSLSPPLSLSSFSISLQLFWGPGLGVGIPQVSLASLHSHKGKIQGDGRKFLNRFKSYLGSQISPQSLNDVHIYRLQPKSAAKGDFFHIFLSLIVSSRRHGLQMANETDEVLLGKRPR